MKHTKHVKSCSGTHEQLAEEIGDLLYDSLAYFLQLLSAKIKDDAEQDQTRGRLKLAKELHACADHLRMAGEHIETAWKVCEPYMNKVPKS